MVITRTIEKIHELRERPDHERRAIAFVVTGIGTLILLFAWSFFTVPSVAGSVRQLAGIGGEDGGIVQQTASVLGAVSVNGDSSPDSAGQEPLLIVESSGEGRVRLTTPTQ